MKKNKKYILVIITVLLLGPLFSVLSFANDTLRDETPVVLTGASNIKTITLVADDDVVPLEKTSIEIDYTSLFSRGFSDSSIYSEILIPTDEVYIVSDIQYVVSYLVTLNVNYIEGYARDSKYCALTFNCIAVGDADPEEDDKRITLYQIPIEKIILTYDMHAIHKYSVDFTRPYDGNIDATIGFNSNVEWESQLTYNTLGFDYVSYYYHNTDLGRNISYYRIKDDVNNFLRRTNSNQVSNPRYVPVGVRYNYQDVNMSTVSRYEDNVLQSNGNQYDKYIYSICTFAKQEITFTEPYLGRFTITDMFSQNTKSDILFLNETGQIYTDNFEIGTFLKNSVDNFLEFEILEGYSLADLLWMIVGIAAVFALFFLLLGR